MIAILLAVLLAAPVPCPQPHRRSGAVAKFRRANPCPSTGRKTGACPGYKVDHVCPLACCGLDAPQNMQWQTTAAAKAKDRWELQCSRSCTARRPMP